MATTPKKVTAPVLGRALDDTESDALRRASTEQDSPLNELVQGAAGEVGKAYGVGVTEEYPESTIYTHLKKSEKQLGLREKGLKVRTWNKSTGSGANKEWPHIAFKVVELPKKDEPATT